MAFAYEIMDGYGRFLCYVDRDNKQRGREERLTYNVRMLKSGLAVPYFIWPNINLFRKQGSLVEAVPAPAKFREFVNSHKRIKMARNFVIDARRAGVGIFSNQDPITLLPFELRYIAGRRSLSRYVLDMSKDLPNILKPTDYYLIPNEEDGLFMMSILCYCLRKEGTKLHNNKPLLFGAISCIFARRL
jgi:hypothetical protein